MLEDADAGKNASLLSGNADASGGSDNQTSSTEPEWVNGWDDHHPHRIDPDENIENR